MAVRRSSPYFSFMASSSSFKMALTRLSSARTSR